MELPVFQQRANNKSPWKTFFHTRRIAISLLPRQRGLTPELFSKKSPNTSPPPLAYHPGEITLFQCTRCKTRTPLTNFDLSFRGHPPESLAVCATVSLRECESGQRGYGMHFSGTASKKLQGIPGPLYASSSFRQPRSVTPANFIRSQELSMTANNGTPFTNERASRRWFRAYSATRASGVSRY